MARCSTRARTVVRSRDPTWDEVAAFELNWIERPEECLIEVHDDGPANGLVFLGAVTFGLDEILAAGKMTRPLTTLPDAYPARERVQGELVFDLDFEAFFW